MEEDLKKIESLIFVKEWSIKELCDKLSLKEEELLKLIKKINDSLKDRPYYILFDQYSKKIRFEIKDEYKEVVKKFVKPELSEIELKILSLIVNNFSYSEIIKKFGVRGKNILRKLEEDGWTKIKKDGRIYKFYLTKKFKENFKIKNG